MLEQVGGGTLRTFRLRLLSDGGESRAGWTTCRDDHDRFVLVDVVHDRLYKGLDVECGDVPHVRRCEMLVKDCDSLGVDFPAHGQHWLDPEVKEGRAGGPDPVEEAEVHHGCVVEQFARQLLYAFLSTRPRHLGGKVWWTVAILRWVGSRLPCCP